MKEQFETVRLGLQVCVMTHGNHNDKCDEWRAVALDALAKIEAGHERVTQGKAIQYSIEYLGFRRVVIGEWFTGWGNGLFCWTDKDPSEKEHHVYRLNLPAPEQKEQPKCLSCGGTKFIKSVGRRVPCRACLQPAEQKEPAQPPAPTPSDTEMLDWLADQYCPGAYDTDPIITAITHGDPADLRATIRAAMQKAAAALESRVLA